MPLLDHFQPPLSTARHWESFYTAWAAEITRTLNRRVLPPECFAEVQIHLGGHVEIDGAAREPPAGLVMPAVFPDEIEVQVFRSSGGATLVAAIAFVSPSNKDRPETRRAFTDKCATYLQMGVGLVVVDVVTERQANLHNELIRRLEQPDKFEILPAAPLYTVAYRPSRRESGDQIEIWPVPLALGQALPTMPLALRGVATLPLDLETTYATTCEDCRF
jgi:hypothetical protein